MNLFISKKDTVNVKVYSWLDEKNNVNAVSNEDDRPKDKDVVQNVFVFKKPSYADSRKIMEKSSTFTGDVKNPVSVDPGEMNDQILKTLLREWDLTDEKNEPVACDARHINDLHPAVARAAVDGIYKHIEL